MGFVILGVAIWAHIQRPTLFDLGQYDLIFYQNKPSIQPQPTLITQLPSHHK